MGFGTGIRVWGLGFGTGIRVWGLGFGTGFRVGDMKQNEHQKHETRGGTGLGTGDEQISKNDKAGGNGLNRAGPVDRRRLQARSKARPELGR